MSIEQEPRPTLPSSDYGTAPGQVICDHGDTVATVYLPPDHGGGSAKDICEAIADSRPKVDILSTEVIVGIPLILASVAAVAFRAGARMQRLPLTGYQRRQQAFDNITGNRQNSR